MVCTVLDIRYRLLVNGCWINRLIGAVRTSVTLLVQNMGNTCCSLVTHFVDHMQFYSGGYPPE